MEASRERTDGELLAAFADGGDQSAFRELVQRYGSMVYGVCLRVVCDHHEAEDAVQAVFLTLARKAVSLRRNASVGGWLHTVARRLAKDVRNARYRREAREDRAMRDQMIQDRQESDLGGFREQLDEAIGVLPERYRLPLVLFHLRGCSLEQTASQLRLNTNTASTRLARGREMLRRKLVRRGVTVGSVGALTTLLSAEAGAAVLPASFASAMVKAAGLAAAGKLAAGVGTGVVSANVAALAKGACNMLFWSSVKTAAAATAACVVVAGTGVVVAQKAVEPAITHKTVMEKPTPAMCELTVSLYTGGDREGGFSVNSAYRPVRVVAIHSQPPLMTLATGEVITAWTLRSDTFGLIAKPARVKFVVQTTKIKNDRPQYWIKEVEGRSVPELVKLSAADNGQTIRTTVGSLVVIGLKNDRLGAGWEPAPKEIDGESVALRTPNRTRNCDFFDWIYAHAFRPPDATVSNTVGTYVYNYTCARTGKSTIHLLHMEPGGPIPHRRATSTKLGDFSVNVDVGNDNSDSSALERKLKSIVIPRWRITEEPLAKAVAKLVDAISTNDPQHAGVVIELDPPTPSLRLQLFTLLTMDSRESATAMRILETMAQVSGQKVTFEKHRVVLSPLQPDKTTVVIPEISFKGTPVAEVVKVLQAQTGVPIRLQRSGNLPSVTLTAKNIGLDNAVFSAAAQTGLVMGYEKDGLLLR